MLVVAVYGVLLLHDRQRFGIREGPAAAAGVDPLPNLQQQPDLATITLVTDCTPLHKPAGTHGTHCQNRVALECRLIGVLSNLHSPVRVAWHVVVLRPAIPRLCTALPRVVVLHTCNQFSTPVVKRRLSGGCRPRSWSAQLKKDDSVVAAGRGRQAWRFHESCHRCRAIEALLF